MFFYVLRISIDQVIGTLTFVIYFLYEHFESQVRFTLYQHRKSQL